MIWMLPSLYLSGLWLARAHFVKYKTFSVGGASSSAVDMSPNSQIPLCTLTRAMPPLQYGEGKSSDPSQDESFCNIIRKLPPVSDGF